MAVAEHEYFARPGAASPATVAQLSRFELSGGDDDWAVTPHGKTLGRALAERNLVQGKRVLELGAGLGNHTIVLLRQGAAQVVVTEVHQRLLETTRRNVDQNCPESKEHIEYRVADWLDTEGRFDVVVTNPPFCKSGKQNRRYYIDSLILDAHKRLVPGGMLIFVQSSMADLAKTQRRLTENGFRHDILGESRGCFRDYYFEDEGFLAEIERFPGAYEQDGETRFERLFVTCATLEHFETPDSAHVLTE